MSNITDLLEQKWPAFVIIGMGVFLLIANLERARVVGIVFSIGIIILGLKNYRVAKKKEGGGNDTRRTDGKERLVGIPGSTKSGTHGRTKKSINTKKRRKTTDRYKTNTRSNTGSAVFKKPSRK